MRYYFDTEFIEKPYTIDLISIGIVSETGDEFYRESSESDWLQANPWVLENVKPHLLGGKYEMSNWHDNGTTHGTTWNNEQEPAPGDNSVKFTSIPRRLTGILLDWILPFLAVIVVGNGLFSDAV